MIPMKGYRVLLVGGAGFIGHNLALRLKQLGADVTVVDSLSVNNLHSITKTKDVNPNADLYLAVIHERLRLLKEAGIPLIEQDSREYHQLSDLALKLRPDAIVHLAAVSHANVSNKDPFSTFDHSFRTLENMLDIARSKELAVKHFVYFSSSMVYGNFPDRFVTEDTVCNPLGIYGALKYAGEKIVIAYNQVFGLPYTIIRPSALYGERCISRRVGQIFIENAIQGKTITIAGDGSDELDFTYIDDLVSGVVNVLENEGSRNQIFNITTGRSRSIADMAKIVSSHFPGIKVEFTPKDQLMPDRGTLSVEKARRLIGYNPKFDLEAGLARYIDWYRTFARTRAEKGVAAVR